MQRGAIGHIIAFKDYPTGNSYQFHYDRMGNVMARTDLDGTNATIYDQEAFGNVLAGSSDGYHLTTKEYHSGIGLYYFFQRWYDPALGRFTQKDLIESINRYLYCHNNPVNCLDPQGLLGTYVPWQPWPTPAPELDWPLLPREPDIPDPCKGKRSYTYDDCLDRAWRTLLGCLGAGLGPPNAIATSCGYVCAVYPPGCAGCLAVYLGIDIVIAGVCAYNYFSMKADCKNMGKNIPWQIYE